MARVLIVEDNPEIARLYESIFAQHQTHVLGDVPDAIMFLQTSRPDLIIMDFHLPSGSGVNILSFVRSQTKLRDVPILGISVDDMLKSTAKQRGVDAFLTKPIDVGELIDTAQSLMSSTRKVPSREMQAMLKEYADAYQGVYKRPPKGQWTGSQVLIDGHPCDETWLKSETRRLKSLVANGNEPKSYLLKLIDKLRRL
jgi:CheY-like chemotaxis protein